MGALAYAIAKAGKAGRKIEAKASIPGIGEGEIIIGGEPVPGEEEPVAIPQ
jgi:hypothetical protein